MTDQTAAGSAAPESAPESAQETAQGPPGPPTFAPPAMPAPGWRPPKQPLRDRLFRFRSVLAVGIAGLLIGGGAGAGGVAIAHSRSDGGHVPGRGQFPGQRQFPRQGRLPGGGQFGPYGGPGTGGDGEQEGSNS